MAKAVKLPSGTWMVRASRTINGEKQRRCFTAPSKKEAIVAAALWQEERRQSKYGYMTVRQAADRYIDLRRPTCSPYTIHSYELYLRSLGAFQDIPVDQVTNDDVQQLVNRWVAEGSAPKTIRNRYSFVRAACMDIRPEYNIRAVLPRKVKPIRNIPTDADIARLTNLVKGGPLEIPVLLALFGPLRAGEICALTADNIEGNIIHVRAAAVQIGYTNTISIKGPKSYAGYRDIAVPDFVIEKLPKTGPVTNLKPRTLSQTFCRMVRREFEKPFNFHSLRHFAASKMYAVGIDKEQAMRRGGWENFNTMTDIYMHALASDIQDTDKKFNREMLRVVSGKRKSKASANKNANKDSNSTHLSGVSAVG